MHSLVITKNAGLRRQSGFTLVELMVALVLGLLVVFGATQLFLTSSQAFRSIEDINKRQEVVSYISNIIGYEVRISGAGTGPVKTGGSGGVVNEGDRLKIEFQDNSYMPYCPSGTTVIDGLEYFVDFGKSSLMVEASCNDVLQGEKEVIAGISDIQFKAEKIKGNDAYVDVILTLESPRSSSVSDVINMRFTRHSKAIFE
ncbi:PilW family protein [Halomonas sp. HK25]|uniref:PilW family protein n=1 Tax=Halomonas sp. HK25 TaxID=3394321 RepID=UPI0039FC4905